jgi:N-acetylglucosamine malate deacetylase 2
VRLILIFIILLLSVSCRVKLTSLSSYAATESYPDDTNLVDIQPKKALVVIAHDDDMCNMTGTLSLLNKSGWDIHIVSLSQTPERNNAHVKACKNIADTVFFFPFSHTDFRNGLDTTKVLYAPIPKQEHFQVFNVEPMRSFLISYTQKFEPTIIFTLDSDIGAYGNPEHVFVSSLILELFKEKQIHAKMIYQSVYTDHMEEKIMERHSVEMKKWGYAGNEWEEAKRIYGVSGMPEPSVQINIYSEANEKMNYLMSYNERERKVIGFFVPCFDKFEPKDYFGLFNREFYRVIQ